MKNLLKLSARRRCCLNEACGPRVWLPKMCSLVVGCKPRLGHLWQCWYCALFRGIGLSSQQGHSSTTLPEFATRGHFQANLPELDTSGILPIIECWLWEPQASKFVVVVGLWYQTGLKFLLWCWQLTTAYVDILFSILMFLNNKPSCWNKNSSQRSCNVMNFDEVGRGTKWDCFWSTSLNPFIAAIKMSNSPVLLMLSQRICWPYGSFLTDS